MFSVFVNVFCKKVHGLVVVVVPVAGLTGFRRKPPRGNTPLHVAAYWGNVEAAELLLSKGAAVDATNLAGPGPQIREACVRNPVSNLGHLKKHFWDLKF